VRARSDLASRHAGLVLTFGGASDNNVGRAVEVAKRVNDALAALGQQGYVFRGTVYRPFIGLATPPDVATVDVYVFKL
jgi:hypothetical protein